MAQTSNLSPTTTDSDGAEALGPQYLLSRLDTTCSFCGTAIPRGEKIYPQPEPDDAWVRSSNFKAQWMHYECAQTHFRELNQPMTPPICRHWIQKGQCLYRDRCFYRHPPDAELPPETQALRAAAAAASTLPRRAAAPGARFRNRVRSRLRFGVLRHWLLATFGAAALAQGSGVADIGGGGGDAAFELSAAAGVPATIVDPRQPCMWKCVKKLSAGVYHRTSLFDGGLSTSAAHAAAHAVAPQHARVALTPPLIAALGALADQCTRCGASGMLRVPFCASMQSSPQAAQASTAEPVSEGAGQALGDCLSEAGSKVWCQECRRAWEEFVCVLRDEAEHAESIVWTKRGLQGHEGDGLQPSEDDMYEAAAVPEDLAAGLPGPYAIPSDRLPDLVHGRAITADPCRVAAALLSCSLLLGLHPDQALGPTLELAAALGKPFAVVPCCVYAAEFPRRRLRSGARVRSYEQLLQWVGERPGVQRCELPFSGRNVVFYSTGTAAPSASGP